ncbi:I78 family peptidase inhibitor [Brevundimonas sp. 2R-24]|uniref:I78 family peptidase inhibitor n=1 Tax=Peiella sedimenti TaxID=3061083 RepID=A0ABT8SIG7_9CAUL|nr:I78 family peptidase inhibitor [Caulobacteraceae bacterium XZ-24]
MGRSTLIGWAGLVLAGCAAAPEPMPPPGTGEGDQCGAAANQHLIGRNIAAVSFPADANVRVACTTCAVTMDYSPTRLNVFFDQDSGLIREVRCG